MNHRRPPILPQDSSRDVERAVYLGVEDGYHVFKGTTPGRVSYGDGHEVYRIEVLPPGGVEVGEEVMIRYVVTRWSGLHRAVRLRP